MPGAQWRLGPHSGKHSPSALPCTVPGSHGYQRVGSVKLGDTVKKGDLIAQITTVTQALGPLPDGTIQIRYEDEPRQEFELLEEVRALARESFERRSLN